MLASPGLGVYLINNQTSTNRLIEDIGMMVKKGTEDERFQVAAISTLMAAKEAGEVRNRAVHDWWVPAETEVGADGEQPVPGTRWSGYRAARGGLGFSRPPGDERGLAWLDDALIVVKRARIRAQALGQGLWEVLPGYEGAREEPPNAENSLELAMRTMEDRFVLLEDGGYRVDSN